MDGESHPNSRKSYFQLHVAINTRSPWFRLLESDIRRISYRWQDKNFHVTVAFLDDLLDKAGAEKVADLLDEELQNSCAPVVTFDKLDVFTAHSGKQHIVNLTAGFISPEFKAFVHRIRGGLLKEGCHMQDYGAQEFKLHVTLARIWVSQIDLQPLQERIGKINVPPITLTLEDADYRFYGRDNSLIRKWKLPESREE